MRWWPWPKTRRPGWGRRRVRRRPCCVGAPCRPDPAGPRRAIGSRRRRRCRGLEQGGVGVAVVVGQRHDDGLIDHIGRVGVTLKQVGDVPGIQPGVLDTDVGGLLLFNCVGGGNVVGRRVVVEVDRHGLPVLLLVVGSSDRSRAFSDWRSLLSDSSSLLRCSRCRICAIPAMLMPWATSSLMRCRRSRSSSLYRRVPPSVRTGVSSPRRSYRRSVCGSIPDNSAATEMPYTPRADRARGSSGTDLLQFHANNFFTFILAQNSVWCYKKPITVR